MRLAPPVIALLSLFWAIPAAGQDRDTERATRAVEAVLQCRAVPDEATRIACFDRTTLLLEGASKRTEIVLVDREDSVETRRAQFGFSPRRFRPFGLGREVDNDVSEVTSTIVSASSAARHPNIRFSIKDGSIWETTQGTRGSPPRTGESVTIKRGPLGNYLASVGGRISLRVMRVD